jgi:hypothetical protein
MGSGLVNSAKKVQAKCKLGANQVGKNTRGKAGHLMRWLEIRGRIAMYFS